MKVNTALENQWVSESFQSIAKMRSAPKANKIFKSLFKDVGQLPIVDQGQSIIAGYTDDLSLTYKLPLPVIIFGDHTRIFKYIDFSFAIGADGVKIIYPIAGKLHSKYLYYALTFIPIRNEGYSRHSKLLKEINIFYPLNIDEQKKIVDILSVWDKALQNNMILIQSKIKLKHTLMQKLLTGNLRFREFSKEGFHKTELRKFLIPTVRPVPRPNVSYTALSIRSHGKGTFLRTVENPETVMMDTLYEVKENDLIVNITFAWEGAIAIVKKIDEGVLVSHRFPTYTFNREIVIPEYFRYVIQTKKLVHALGLVSPGGAGRNRVLSKKDFLNIVVSIPSVDEQQKIATLLNGVDKEIELLENNLECLSTQKKGLMQKLLTGQIRVKV